MRAVSEATAFDLGVDLQTVRERVAAIKRSWTPEEVAARAAEGRRRRRDLRALVEALEQEQAFDCDDCPELTLVGG